MFIYFRAETDEHALSETGGTALSVSLNEHDDNLTLGAEGNSDSFNVVMNFLLLYSVLKFVLNNVIIWYSR